MVMTPEISSTTPLPSCPKEHDVFLSFRGDETSYLRSYLCKALKEKGISAAFSRDYHEDEKLEMGWKAKATSVAPTGGLIEGSRFAIVVFLKNYASSTCCLDELAKVAECMNELGLIVYPVFYHVDPTDVREQTGDYGGAFANHERVFEENMEKVNKWREALTQVASLSPWDLKNCYETVFIEKIVKDIVEKLNQACQFGDGDHNGLLVGMVSRVKKVLVGLNDVRTISICGVRGIGKTAIAKQVFKSTSPKFEASAFIANIRVEIAKKRQRHLQERRYQSLLLNMEGSVPNDCNTMINELRKKLQSKRVLIVLDDVDLLKQIEGLVGDWTKQKHSWLSAGSRVILTTRKKDLLKTYGEKFIYEVEKLTNDEALELLCQKAFDEGGILDEYREVSNNIVENASGHPLTLKTLGSKLYDRTVVGWSEELEKLKKNPNKYMV